MRGTTERRYPIQSHEGYGFFAGMTPANTQVLIGLLCPDLIAFSFDSEGNLLGVERRGLEFFREKAAPYNIYDARIPGHVDAWKRDIGFRPATIRVKKFLSSEPYAGIEDRPCHFDEVLADSESSEEEKTDILDSIRHWDGAGQFVLFWGNDYWLDDSGEVVSS